MSPVTSWNLSVEGRSDAGCARRENQDAIRWVLDSGRPEAMVVIADGMGGVVGGATASALAVGEIIRGYQAGRRVLVEMMQSAGRRIFELAQTREDLKGMGTTCIALEIAAGEAKAAYIGDSRLYLVRGGQIYQMTEDHSMVAELVRRGEINREQARNHPDRNVILRALGTAERAEIASWDWPLSVRQGDRLVLSTDGLHDLLEDHEILAIVSSQAAGPACEELVATAKSRGGYDNITVGSLTVD